MSATGQLAFEPRNGITRCLVCDAPLTAEGMCTRVNDWAHYGDHASDYGFRDDDVTWAGHFTGFHTRTEAMTAPPISFLIDGFLQREGVTAIAGPVRERKSLIALNVAHALCTGEKLFGHFEVTQKPKQVLYLCPEVSLGPFTDRLKKIGLIDHVGSTFFFQTLSTKYPIGLEDEDFLELMPGSVVFLDTAIRFLKGDENSSKDVREFADSILGLLHEKAEAVVMLHHSPKGNSDAMTLENMMRGSGDMGAFIACCWGTKLQDPTKPYESASFLSNLKQRDFESKDFEVTSGPDCLLHYVESEDPVTLNSRRGHPANSDGKEEAAIALMKENPKLSLRLTVALLKEHGIKRGKDWVQQKRFEMLQESGGQMP